MRDVERKREKERDKERWREKERERGWIREIEGERECVSYWILTLGKVLSMKGRAINFLLSFEVNLDAPNIS